MKDKTETVLKHSTKHNTPHRPCASLRPSLVPDGVNNKNGVMENGQDVPAKGGMVTSDYVPGDLIIAEFSSCLWPALVTHVYVEKLKVITLVLEQDEVVIKRDVQKFSDESQLEMIVSKMNKGEQEDFSMASDALLELKAMTLRERIEYFGSTVGLEDEEENLDLGSETIVNGHSDDDNVEMGAEVVNGHSDSENVESEVMNGGGKASNGVVNGENDVVIEENGFLNAKGQYTIVNGVANGDTDAEVDAVIEKDIIMNGHTEFVKSISEECDENEAINLSNDELELENSQDEDEREETVEDKVVTGEVEVVTGDDTIAEDLMEVEEVTEEIGDEKEDVSDSESVIMDQLIGDDDTEELPLSQPEAAPVPEEACGIIETVPVTDVISEEKKEQPAEEDQQQTEEKAEGKSDEVTEKKSPAKEIADFFKGLEAKLHEDKSVDPAAEECKEIEEKTTEDSSTITSEEVVKSEEVSSEENSQMLETIVAFIVPYYTELFKDIELEKIQQQILSDVQTLQPEELKLILKCQANPAAMNKKGHHGTGLQLSLDKIIPKLVQLSSNSLLSLPDVGPGTPPKTPSPDRTLTRSFYHGFYKPVVLKTVDDHNPFPVTILDIFTNADGTLAKKLEKLTKGPKGPKGWRLSYKLPNMRESKLSSPSQAPKTPRTPKAPKAPKTPKSDTDTPEKPNKRRKIDKPAKKEKSAEDKAKEMALLAVKKLSVLFRIKDIQDTLTNPLDLTASEINWAHNDDRPRYFDLAEEISELDENSRAIHCRAIVAFVKATPNRTRLDWSTLPQAKQKKFITEAAKTKEDSGPLVKHNERLLEEWVELDKCWKSPEKKDTKKQTLEQMQRVEHMCISCFKMGEDSKLFSPCSTCHGMFHKECMVPTTEQPEPAAGEKVVKKRGRKSKAELEKLSEEGAKSPEKKELKTKMQCTECQQGAVCALCRGREGELNKCSQCPHLYHEGCVMPHMSSQIVSPTSFICPLHVCGSCEARPELSIKGFVRCVRCPQAFHPNHIPAGCMKLSKHHMLCYRHYKGFASPVAVAPADQPTKRKKKKGVNNKPKKTPANTHVNVPFCFQCTIGGDLICCDECPASFHKECAPEDAKLREGSTSWLCPDCIVGKKAFVGDIIWVKFGAYRWWPSQILDKTDLPDNIKTKARKPCQFPVVCLGTGEYAWIDMERVYLYEDGDKGVSLSSGGTMSQNFNFAVVEARTLFNKAKPIKEALLRESALVTNNDKKPAPFKFIKVNVPYNASMRELEKLMKLERAPFPCECDGSDKCGLDSDCINRMLLTECPAACRWGEDCCNQRFQRRTYPVTKLVKTQGRGWGLIAQEDITPGTLVHEYVGEIIDEGEVNRRLADYQKSGITDYYMLTVENSRIIDAKPKANNARFMNHSCDPNCETQKWNVCGLTCIGLFANRHIESGAELTFDYQFDTRGQGKKQCLCGAANCSGFLGVKAKKLYEEKEEKVEKKGRGRKRKKKTKTEDPAKAALKAEKLVAEKKQAEEKATQATAKRAERLSKRSFVVSPRTMQFLENGLEVQDNVQDLSLDEGKSGVMDGFEKVVAEISKGLQVEDVLREEMVKGGHILPEGTEDAARAIVEGVRVMEELNSQEPMDVAI